MLNPKKKISKKELKEDALISTYAKTMTFYEQNKRYISIGLTSLVAVIILIVVLVNNRNANNEKAAAELGKVLQLFDGNQYQQAVDGVPERNIAGLKSIVDNYGGTSAGQSARFYLANSYYNLGRYDEALAQFEDYSPTDDVLDVSRLAGVASCYEAKGNPSEAASNFEKAATKYADDVTAAENLSHAARNYVQAGKKEHALELYKKIKKDYPKSAAARDVDKFIAQLSV